MEIIYIDKDSLFVEPMDTYTIGKHRYALLRSHPRGDGFPGSAHTFSISFDYIHWGVLRALRDMQLGQTIYTNLWEHNYKEDLIRRTREHYDKST